MEHEDYFMHSQQPDTSHYREPDQSNPSPPFCILKMYINIFLHPRLGLPSILIPPGLPIKNVY